MRPTSLSFGLTIAAFVLLNLTTLTSCQIAGCDANGITCYDKTSKVKDGICSYDATKNGIGIVSIDSSITSDGPLTWTLTEEYRTPKHADFTGRYFYIGSPASLNFEHVTDFGACAFALSSNITAALQLPSGFSDVGGFSCDSVMGQTCTADVTTMVRDELHRILDSNGTELTGSVCETIGLNLYRQPYPDSCVAAFKSDQWVGGSSITLTNQTFGYQTPQSSPNCTLTTGGPTYNIATGPPGIQFDGKANNPEVKQFKNGTTPIFTLFYNEPWNNATTGPAPFLNEPEVHLSCLRKVQTPEEQKLAESGTIRPHADMRNLGLASLLVFLVLLSNL